MRAVAIAAIAFAAIFGSTVFGMLLRRILPAHHLSAESKEVVRLAVALIATLAALVLGLLIASTRSSYDQTSGQVSRMITDVVVLDRLLDEYGPEATPLRQMLRNSIGPSVDAIWRGDDRTSGSFRPSAQSEAAFYRLQELSPKNDVQRALQSRAIQISTDLLQTRLLVFAQPADAMSTPFVVVLVLWLVIIFGSFSVFSQPNATIFVVLLVCVMSVSSAIFLILEMGRPFDGLMQISSTPLRNALAPLPR